LQDSRVITEDRARDICREFLVDRYHRARYRDAKIEFHTLSPTEEGGVSAYYLEGDLEVRSGTLVAQFLFPADRYHFKMWVRLDGGRILRWEMT